MDQLPPLGTGIFQVLQPTIKIYEPLILANANTIRSVKKETFKYGPTDRHQLDVYYAPKPSIKSGRKPVLVFFYGGGLMHGDKTLPAADGLVHPNIASFFALKYGYTTIVSDYRLIKHGAKFPSGGEDVGMTVDWIVNNGVGQGPEPIDLFIMGNSAGGLHLSTFLLHSSTKNIRSKVLCGGDVRLRNAVLLSVPFAFGNPDATRGETLKGYFGDIHANSPLGLLKTARQESGIDILPHIQLYTLNGTLDPDSEILGPREEFLQEWSKIEDSNSRGTMKTGMMPGHNHISPVFSLGTAIEKEEAWGHQVGEFCEASRS